MNIIRIMYAIKIYDIYYVLRICYIYYICDIKLICFICRLSNWMRSKQEVFLRDRCPLGRRVAT